MGGRAMVAASAARRRGLVGIKGNEAMLTLFLVMCAPLATARDQAFERQHVLSVSTPDIDGGVVSEITWDNGALLLQGVVANPDGSISARYVVIPAKGTTLAKLKEPTATPIDYWDKKAKRVS